MIIIEITDPNEETAKLVFHWRDDADQMGPLCLVPPPLRPAHKSTRARRVPPLLDSGGLPIALAGCLMEGPCGLCAMVVEDDAS